MQNNETKKDLDDFWVELIDKSEWAKNEARKNPGEFKNLHILGVKKNTTNYISPGSKIEQGKEIVLKTHKKSLLSTRLVVLLIILVIVIYAGSLFYFCLRSGSSCTGDLSFKNYLVFYLKFFLSIINTIKII